MLGLLWWLSGKESTCNTGDAKDAGSIPGLGIFPGGGHGNQLQCSCMENPLDRGAWQVTVHVIAESQTQLKRLSVRNTMLCFLISNTGYDCKYQHVKMPARAIVQKIEYLYMNFIFC